jgi:hypothetical protein
MFLIRCRSACREHHKGLVLTAAVADLQCFGVPPGEAAHFI